MGQTKSSSLDTPKISKNNHQSTWPGEILRPRLSSAQKRDMGPVGPPITGGGMGSGALLIGLHATPGALVVWSSVSETGYWDRECPLVLELTLVSKRVSSLGQGMGFDYCLYLWIKQSPLQGEQTQGKTQNMLARLHFLSGLGMRWHIFWRAVSDREENDVGFHTETAAPLPRPA